jgi:UDP-N-acetylglucosamine 2-epimerase (non-hydrolysing)
MTRLLVVFGTRPEVIKLAPVINELRARASRGEDVDVTVCCTGQHKELLTGALDAFDLEPDIDLSVMRENQGLCGLLGRLLQGLEPVLKEVQPDIVVAQGDTTTTMAAGLAGFCHGAGFAHVEAGLRTHDKRQPFPEELNRRVAGVVADYNFVPTAGAAEALEREAYAPDSIFLTGNTVVDATHWAKQRADQLALPPELDPGDAPLMLVTAHRRENFGEAFRDMCFGIREVAESFPELRVIYPVHLNPNVRQPVQEILGPCKRISLVEPLDYVTFLALMNRSRLILTDSGGVQEEAPTLGKPVLVMRNKTERPEAVLAGNVRLVGTDRLSIVEAATELLSDEAAWEAMAQVRSVYGDGLASRRIAEVLLTGRMETPAFQAWSTTDAQMPASAIG